MIPMAVAAGVREGTVSCAFRRWAEPRVKIGSSQLTSAGRIGFTAVSEVTDLDALTDDDARAAGVSDADELRRRLAPGRTSAGPRASQGGDHVFRVELTWLGEDPRVELRDRVPRRAELRKLTEDVAALDAGRRTGPWTRPILEWIRDHPGVVSTELAALLDRDLLPMKADIRRLKALGLTESLRVGYRLSPRGRAYLRSLPDH